MRTSRPKTRANRCANPPQALQSICTGAGCTHANLCLGYGNDLKFDPCRKKHFCLSFLGDPATSLTLGNLKTASGKSEEKDLQPAPQAGGTDESHPSSRFKEEQTLQKRSSCLQARQSATLLGSAVKAEQLWAAVMAYRGLVGAILPCAVVGAALWLLLKQALLKKHHLRTRSLHAEKPKSGSGTPRDTFQVLLCTR